ncbi:MAG: class I SAM-dependent methyltransferase, partial [Hyphomonadaceae bacterium]
MLERFVQRFFREGALIIRLPDREILAGRPEPGTPPPIVRVRDYGTAARIARNPHLALGEAYMDGAIVMERGDIYDLLENAARNFRSDRKTDLWSKFKRGLAKMVSNANARAAARRNVA